MSKYDDMLQAILQDLYERNSSDEARQLDALAMILAELRLLNDKLQEGVGTYQVRE